MEHFAKLLDEFQDSKSNNKQAELMQTMLLDNDVFETDAAASNLRHEHRESLLDADDEAGSSRSLSSSSLRDFLTDALMERSLDVDPLEQSLAPPLAGSADEFGASLDAQLRERHLRDAQIHISPTEREIGV